MVVKDLENAREELGQFVITKHIRDKHISVEDAVLLQRFEEETNPTKLYSKFSNEETAAEAITAALKQNKRRISNWESNGQKSFIKFFVKMDDVIGYGFTKDRSRFELNTLTVILCRNKRQGFRIKSAYPSL